MLSQEVERAIREMGFKDLTPVQRETIPLMLSGNNVLVQAKTGSGKTAAFGIPIVELGRRALVLSPTRELVRQIADHIRAIGKYKGVKVAEIYGGMPYDPQIEELEGANVVVATPGRLIDLWKRGEVDLSSFEVVVVDEADLMLDMGFIEDVSLILSNAENRKITGMFSATVPKEVEKLAEKFMPEYELVRVSHGLAEVKHRFVYVRGWQDKVQALRREIEHSDGSVVVFVKTREGVKRLARQMKGAVELRGDLPQKVRNRNIDLFRKGRVRVLITTDVASRGIDVPSVNKVINFDAPESLKTYVHRAGRTGRMGRPGEVVTLLTEKERGLEEEVKRLIQSVSSGVIEEVSAFD
ncbi:MAG: DEAD/DEAH box helicase [Thermoprotei archaeon]